MDNLEFIKKEIDKEIFVMDLLRLRNQQDSSTLFGKIIIEYIDERITELRLQKEASEKEIEDRNKEAELNLKRRLDEDIESNKIWTRSLLVLSILFIVTSSLGGLSPGTIFITSLPGLFITFLVWRHGDDLRRRR